MVHFFRASFFLFLATILLITNASASTNVITNPSFESGFTNWDVSAYPAWIGFNVGTIYNENVYATNGTYFAQGYSDCVNSTGTARVYTSNTPLLNGKTYRVCADVGKSGGDSRFCLWESVGLDGAISCSASETVTRKKLIGNTTALQMTNICKDLTNNTGSDTELYFTMRDDGLCSGSGMAFGVDNITAYEYQNLSITNLSAISEIENNAFYLYFTISGNLDGAITDANVVINFNSEGDRVATYDSILQKYKLLIAIHAVGSYSYTISATKSGAYIATNSSGTVAIVPNPSSHITLTPISNVSSISFSTATDINTITINNRDDVIYRVAVDGTGGSYTLTTNLTNTNLDNKQYFIYTSTNGTTWTLNYTNTFGATSSGVIQKIWDTTQTTYRYAFTKTYDSNEIVYYKWVLQDIPVSYKTILNSLSWATLNTPSAYQESDTLHTYDNFTDSNFTPMQNYTTNYFSQLTSTDFNAGLMLQFTGFASTDTNIQIGTRVNSVFTPTETILLTATKKRFGVFIQPLNYSTQLVIQSTGTPSTNIYLSDYALIPTGYFLDRLTILQTDNSVLNAVIISGNSTQYIQEAVPFKFKTTAYDLYGNLTQLRVDALIGGTTIKSYTFPITQATSVGKFYTWDEQIDGVTDLYDTATTTPMPNITLKATLINSSNQSVAEQFKDVKLVQYPYFGSDIIQEVFSLNKKVGTNPHFTWTLRQTNPNHFIGLEIKIFRKGDGINNPLYTTTIYKKDLSCTTLQLCQKDILLNDWVFPDSNTYTASFLVLTNTEYPTYTNPLLLTKIDILTSYFSYETARLLQVFERTSNQYKPDETIPIVLQARDTPFRNMQNDFSVVLSIANCASGNPAIADCAIQSSKYYPTKFIYDDTTGYNYWYFNQTFVLDDGKLFTDGNFLEAIAVLTDNSASHSTASTTILMTNKCASGSYASQFNPTTMSMNLYDSILTGAERALFGCGTPSPLIMDVTNQLYESRLDMNSHHVSSAGQNQSIACLKADTNTYQNTLTQDLVCVVWYKRGEQQIDGFNFLLGNQYSDYSKTNNEAQYLRFNVSGDALLVNDTIILKKSLESEFSVDSINTFGELVSKGFDKVFGTIANPLTDIALTGTTKAGLITNVGADINWDNTFDPNYLSGTFFIKIEGVPVINQYDYQVQYSDLKLLPPKEFLTWAKTNNVKIKIPNTIVTIVENGDTISKQEIASPLVIYNQPSKNITTTDGNKFTQPEILRFNLISDMISDNENNASRTYLPLTFTYIVPDATTFQQAIADALANPQGWVVKNIIWIILAVFIAFILTLFLRNLRGGDGRIPIVSDIWDRRISNQIDWERNQWKG